MERTEARDVSGLVDHLFRHSAGRIVSSLTRVFGPADLELVEDAVQEALERALAEPEMLPARLGSVLDVLYLMFNDGYDALDGDRVVRRDICSEALRLAEIVAEHPETGRPESHALAALFCFQAARFPARQDPSGDILLLSEQDRRSWDRALIERGARHMERAAAGDSLTTFHLEAGIAACHAVAPSFEETDWRAILGFYNQLVRLADSPVFALNRAVAVAMVEGPAAGLAALDGILDHSALARYYLLPATRGELHRRLDEPEPARRCFEDALRIATAAPARRLLQRHIAALAAAEEG